MFSPALNAQTQRGILKGRVLDASTLKPLYQVALKPDQDTAGTKTTADGQYQLNIPFGQHSLLVSAADYHSKNISTIRIGHSATYLDIILVPNAGKESASDSLQAADSVVQTSWMAETALSSYLKMKNASGSIDRITEGQIDPGTDKDGSSLLRRLPGVIVLNDPKTQNYLQSLNILGLGERYNQVMLDDAVFNSFSAASKQYPFSLLPAEAIESVSVQKIGNASLPSDFAGGNVEFRTKAMPDKNFFYIRAGAGFTDGSIGKDLYGDQKNNLEWLGFAGGIRNLPAGFPDTRSEFAMNQKNIQEQVDLSKTLNNNLGPVKYGSVQPDDRILLGFGRIIHLKSGATIGIIAYANHQHNELIDSSTVQVLPDIAQNPYPFTTDKVLIRSQSENLNYRAASQLSGTLNASMLFGRNKVSFRSIIGSLLTNTYTQRTTVYKPDEDSLAHHSISYASESRKFLNLQLSGEHAYGKDGHFKLNWQASYGHFIQENPDERNFLLRQDSSDANRFAIATANIVYDVNNPSAIDLSLTNSGRRWKHLTDNNFSAAVNIMVPFQAFHQTQSLSGGVFIRSRYRVYYSDFLLTQGPAYSSLDGLLAPEQYYPGGLSTTNYYVRPSNTNIFFLKANNRGNYTASVNTGSAFIMLESHLTKSLFLNWGLRVESNSQLVSNTIYQYFSGFKNPRIIPLDENTRVTQFDLLPSANLSYTPIHAIQLHVAYFKSLNRPDMQELVGYRNYDANAFMVRTGNSILANATIIQNFHAGVDWFPNAGTDISVSGFLKKMDQPVENLLTAFGTGNLLSTPFNMPPAEVKGITATISSKLGTTFSVDWLKYITVFASANWIHSKVSAGAIKNTFNPQVPEHTLSGTPDFTMNTGLTIQPPGLPMLSVQYSLTSDYISALGSGPLITLADSKNLLSIPDYRVKGRDQLDLQIAQRIFKSKIQLVVGVNNLLKSSYVEYQDLNGNKKFDAPITLSNRNNTGGYYQGGVDNTVLQMSTQRNYYFSVSYLF